MKINAAFGASLVSLILSGLTLCGFLLPDLLRISSLAISAAFWSASICSLIALSGVRRQRLFPLFAAVAAWIMLSPAAPTVIAWTLWSFHGFAP
jgi:hypothetical protein